MGSTFLWNGNNDFLTENGSRKLDWLGTTRGRVGFVATPDNRLMIYGTGGVAYGGGSRHFEIFDNLNNWDWNGSGGGKHPRRLDPRRRRRICDHQQYHAEGRISVLQPRQFEQRDRGQYVCRHSVAPQLSTAKVTFDGSIFRAGVNYKF